MSAIATAPTRAQAAAQSTDVGPFHVRDGYNLLGCRDVARSRRTTREDQPVIAMTFGQEIDRSRALESTLLMQRTGMARMTTAARLR
jgi:hypothetical protein